MLTPHTGTTAGRKHGELTRKELRKASRRDRRGGPPARGSATAPYPSRQTEPPPERPKNPVSSASRKRASPTPDIPVQNKKRKRLPELTLPGTTSGDAEDGEIEWLEYALRKEKGKSKDDELDDGLDGEHPGPLVRLTSWQIY